jgi:hypothetical protein
LSFLNVYGAQVAPKHLYENTDLLKNPAYTAPIGTASHRRAGCWDSTFYSLGSRLPALLSSTSG